VKEDEKERVHADGRTVNTGANQRTRKEHTEIYICRPSEYRSSIVRNHPYFFIIIIAI